MHEPKRARRIRERETVITPIGEAEVTFRPLARFVPFDQQVRYLMLKTAIESGLRFERICEAGGVDPRLMRRFFFQGSDLRIRTMAEWFWGCGKYAPDFRLVALPLTTTEPGHG